MDRRVHLTLATALLGASVAGCSDGTAPSGFVVTGQIQNHTQAAIPSDARLIGVWTVSSGTPDYAYVFGEGTINRQTGTFRIVFDAPPPAEALNNGALGVGFLVATTDQSVKNGDIIGAALNGFIGITAQHAVIFVGNLPVALQFRGWAADFESGYGAGVGVPVPGDFDKFAPVSRSSLQLILDDLANIQIVNWT